MAKKKEPTAEEIRAQLAALGIRENRNTESTVTFFNNPESADAMKKQLDRDRKP